MNYKVNYNGQETNDFDTLASWFMEVYDKMRSLEEANDQLEEANKQYREDMNQVRILNKSLENEITELKVERSKTNEVLKKYCGSLVAPIPTIVGMVIDDFFYQKAETECQVRELQKAEKTIEKLNKELEERKNERSPRWWSDVMRIEVLKTKADKLTKENRRLREEVESLKGQNEVLKIKNAYPICPIFEANSKEAANRIAERIRKGLD